MGLLDFLARLFFPRKTHPKSADSPTTLGRRSKPRLTPFRRQPGHATWSRNATVVTAEPPYAFARLGVGSGRYLDLTRDGDDALLRELDLPLCHKPGELADWLEMPLGRLAWLVNRFSGDSRPQSERDAHYHFHWKAKRRGGQRLIESPKRTLKQAQRKILRDILDKVPLHAAAHGFTAGRSILTNAGPHVGAAVLVKMDLANFYPSVTFARVTAIFRTLGYNRETAIWLARLTTSALPANIPFLKKDPAAVLPYLRIHLPQGAPTSPALANLSAFSLDIRLTGLTRSFGGTYTRYADDLAFSGPQRFGRSLRVFIPLVRQVLRQERFRINGSKSRIVRPTNALVVTGVVVNEKLNVRRRDFDQLKAVLTNCLRRGPSTQNRDEHPHFAAHLRGRIAHVAHLNAARGARLLEIYDRIDWTH